MTTRGQRSQTAIVVLGVVAIVAISAGVAAARPATGLAAGSTHVRLSDEARESRWAYTNLAMKVRAAPSKAARAIGRLRFNTEDRRPELYLALAVHDEGLGEWVQIRLPRRPNGMTGWVPREALGEYHVVRTQLVIDRRTLWARLYRSGRQIWSARIGVGKRSTPTPAGRYWIRERLPGFGNPIYGPVAFGTSAYSSLSDWPGGGVIGIHGTNQPELIPGRPSHGCVRLKNPAIQRLAKLMPIGTPVWIR